MNARETAQLLRLATGHVERYWAGQGCPDSAEFPLEVGICGAVGGAMAEAVGVALAKHKARKGAYLAPCGQYWSARIMWLYVMAHAIEEGAI